MAIKRDSVNRKTRLIELPIKLAAHIRAGSAIELVNVVETEITPGIKDPMLIRGQPAGSDYGDALFDSMAPGASDTIFDAGVSDTEYTVFDPMLAGAGNTVLDHMLAGPDEVVYDPMLIPR